MYSSWIQPAAAMGGFTVMAKREDTQRAAAVAQGWCQENLAKSGIRTLDIAPAP